MKALGVVTTSQKAVFHIGQIIGSSVQSFFLRSVGVPQGSGLGPLLFLMKIRKSRGPRPEPWGTPTDLKKNDWTELPII